MHRLFGILRVLTSTQDRAPIDAALDKSGYNVHVTLKDPVCYDVDAGYMYYDTYIDGNTLADESMEEMLNCFLAIEGNHGALFICTPQTPEERHLFYFSKGMSSSRQLLHAKDFIDSLKNRLDDNMYWIHTLIAENMLADPFTEQLIGHINAERNRLRKFMVTKREITFGEHKDNHLFEEGNNGGGSASYRKFVKISYPGAPAWQAGDDVVYYNIDSDGKPNARVLIP